MANFPYSNDLILPSWKPWETYSNFSGENGVKRVTPRLSREMINPCNLLSAEPETDTKNPLTQQIFRALTHPFRIPFGSLIHPSENHFLQRNPSHPKCFYITFPFSYSIRFPFLASTQFLFFLFL